MSENTETNEIIITPKKQSGISKALDKIFHFTERGSSMGGEIGAGIGTFFISVCALIMNTRIIGTAYGNYAGAYLATTLVCLAGTVLLGIICNLPLAQTANMGLATVLISMMGTDNGLTYANLMAVTFVAAVIYLVIVLTPARKILVDALPDGVKKALPVGIGLYVALTALKNTGILNADGGVTTASALGVLDTYYFWLMVAAVFVFILLKSLHRKKTALVTFAILIGCMWVGGIVFFMDQFMGGQTAATIVYQRLNLVVATDGASPYNIGAGISSLNIGALFSEGFDFSGYTGSVPMLFVQGAATFLCLGLYTNLGAVRGTAASGGYDEEDYALSAESKALIIGAAMNVAAPVLGASPTAIGTESAVGANDGGRTGLASITTAIGYVIALFTWVFIMLFATGTNGVGMWIEQTETKLAAYVQDTFVFSDLIMVLVGASMLKGIKNVDTQKLSEIVPFAATVVGAAVLGNIAIGVAVGCAAYVICGLLSGDRREVGVPSVILGVIMLLYTVLALM